MAKLRRSSSNDSNGSNGSNGKKKKNGIVNLKIVIEKLQKSLLLGRRSNASNFNNEFEEVGDSTYVPEDVKEGHFAVLAVNDHVPRRFVVPLTYLTHPAFVRLLEQAAEEYGFDHEGALTIPCRPSELERLLAEQWRDSTNGSVGINWGSSFKSMVQSF